jgi:hypothetical protein
MGFLDENISKQKFYIMPNKKPDQPAPTSGRKSLSAKRYEFWARPETMRIIESIPKYRRSHFINLSVRERARLGLDGQKSIIQYAADILQVDQKYLLKLCEKRSALPLSELVRGFEDMESI